jgi:hypothetical protein
LSAFYLLPAAVNPILHLTNGSSVISPMRAAGVVGPIVPWDDVLHEGPVPEGLNLAAMRERRAEFLASCGWGAFADIKRKLEERDAVLGEGRPQFDEIVLWFEHDLYDQLLVLQILDRVPLDDAPRLTAVPDDDYLGTLPPARFQGLFAARRDVTSAQRLAARDAWTAFRSSDPRTLVDVLARVGDLRHLGPALGRHLQQFPSMRNGLSRTEQQALEVIGSGVSRLRDVYVRSHHEREEAIFMGDAGFLTHLESLVCTPRPLLRTSRAVQHLSLDDDVALTDDGRRVLDGDLDRVRTCGIDRWLGGVELSGNGPVWRWDGERQTVRWA